MPVESAQPADVPAVALPGQPVPPAAGQPATRMERRRLEQEQARAARQRPTRTVAPSSAITPRRGLVGAVGAVTAVGLAAGAVALSQLLPQSAQGSPRSTAPAAASPGTSAVADRAPVDTTVLAAARVPRVSRGAELRMTAVERSEQDVQASGCDGTAPARHFANGQIPLSALCVLTFDRRHRLRSDAAVALIRLDGDYKAEFGTHLCLTDSYRSLASQVSLAGRKPGLAARPGTSNHGWGLAVDVCKGPDDPSSARYRWMRAHAPAFGWDNPAWARPGGSSRTEPWHWEYVKGE
ncbi:M15 family metallopeptidase [Angustibacter aerolatus]